MIELKEYRGLIRNHIELAEELNVDIAGLSRQEREEKLVIAAYEAWGNDMGNHINGQFAIAIYDTELEELFCTRDILGAELLFYYTTEDGNLLYATQIVDLFDQPGFKLELEDTLIQFYLGLSYIPGDETLFKGVRKLSPGGWLRFNAAGFQKGRYWQLTYEPDQSKTMNQWADEISEAMDASMASICDPDEQPDSFLSGGVDSSYIVAKGRVKKAYCVSYANQEASEEDQAREVAESLGRDFEGIQVTPEDFFATVDEFLIAYEQPSSDAAGLSLYCAAKQVAKESTLCFSGEGADEFFAGYKAYQDYKRYSRDKHPVYYGATHAMREIDQSHYLKCYNGKWRVKDYMYAVGEEGFKYDIPTWMLLIDMKTYFEGSILFNSTKISRGTGLDIRMPYCDLRIFDIARRVPAYNKVDSWENKLCLRKAAAKDLPKDVAYRTKRGFPVPVREWLADPAYNGDIIRAFESETAEKFFKTKELKALLDMFLGKKTNLWHMARYRNNREGLWRRVWSIYLFIRWYELFFIEGAGRKQD